MMSINFKYIHLYSCEDKFEIQINMILFLCDFKFYYKGIKIKSVINKNKSLV